MGDSGHKGRKDERYFFIETAVVRFSNGSTLLLEIFSTLGWETILLLGFAAVSTGAIHGATGIAGGFLMTAVLAVFIGVKPAVPIMSIALLISHSSRFFLNYRDFDKTAYWIVATVALPCIAFAAWGYGKLPSNMIVILFGVVILLSIPLRRWTQSRQVKTDKKTLGMVAAVYGVASGVTVGPGMLLVPFLLGFGLAKEAFVATLAAIAFTTNVTRTIVFSSTELLQVQYLAVGIFVGLMTIPGNWIGRNVLRKITNERHAVWVDVLTVVGAVNFFWLALR